MPAHRLFTKYVHLLNITTKAVSTTHCSFLLLLQLFELILQSAQLVVFLKKAAEEAEHFKSSMSINQCNIQRLPLVTISHGLFKLLPML